MDRVRTGPVGESPTLRPSGARRAARHPPTSPHPSGVTMIAVDPISVPSPGHLPSASPGDFDAQSTRASHSEQPVPLGGVPRALREAAEMSGLDPVAQLYNEALRYAQEGHLRLARERLQMLLCMAPDDGDARLMLARVHVAGQRWSEALAALDEASNCGVDVPASLRRAVEDHLQAEVASQEEQRTASRAREQGEVKALRQEARRLRTDNAQIGSRVADLEREVRKWAWATAGVSAIACVFVAGSLVLGGGSAAEPEEEGSLAAAEAPVVDEQPSPEAPAAPTTLGQRATEALDRVPGLEGSTLDLKLAGDKAYLAGQVVAARQKKAAEKALAGVDGLATVDVSAVEVLARTQGATHTVGKGDTLSHLAHQYYGESSLTGPIAEANAVDAKGLRIGQVLKIPPVPEK